MGTNGLLMNGKVVSSSSYNSNSAKATVEDTFV